jgi:hypothetical protein
MEEDPIPMHGPSPMCAFHTRPMIPTECAARPSSQSFSGQVVQGASGGARVDTCPQNKVAQHSACVDGCYTHCHNCEGGMVCTCRWRPMLHLSLARVASNRGALLSTRCTCMWRLMLHLSLREGGIKCGASPITRSTRRWRLVLHLSLSEGGIKMRGVAHHAQHPQVASCATPLA